MTILFSWIVSLLLAAYVAGEKGHSHKWWAIAGFLCGPFGLLAACGLPDRRTHKLLKEIKELELL